MNAILRTLLVVLSASCSRSAPASEAIVVEIRNFEFVPAELTAAVGDTVVFRNLDVVPHTATAAGTFDSDSLGAAGEWRWVAPSKGHHPYICIYHPTMRGTLIVE